MNGGFNAIKDIYKTDLYRLAIWRNNNKIKFLMDHEEKLFQKTP